ncbi:MAG: hypothetical protein AAF213_10480 [Pseudomonadota bacterium]
METTQVSANFTFAMNLADPLGINFQPDNGPSSTSPTAITIVSSTGGTLTLTGSGFGGFASDNDDDLTGSVTGFTLTDGNNNQLLSVADINIGLRSYVQITDTETSNNYGLSLFSAIGGAADVVTGDSAADVLFGFDANDTIRGPASKGIRLVAW